MDTRDIQNIKKNTKVGFIWTVLERIIVQLVSFIISIILARLLLPKDYGVISIVLVYINIANAFVISGFGSVLVKKNDIIDDDITFALIVNILVGIILYSLIVIFAPIMITDEQNKSLLIEVINILGINIIVGSINSIYQSVALKRMEYKKIFYSTLVGVVLSGTCGVFMAYNGYGVWSLVVQDIMNCIINTVLLGLLVRWKIGFSIKYNRFRRICFPGLRYMVIGVFNSIYGNVNNFIISKKFGVEGLAYYSKANSFPMILSGTINTAATKVLFPSMSLLINDLIEIKKILRKIIQVATYILFPMIIGIAAISDELIPVLLTNKWIELIPYLKLICTMYLFQPFQMYTVQTIMAIESSKFYMLLEIIKKIICVMILILSVFICTNMIEIILFMTLSQIIASLICSIAIKNKINYTYKEQFQDFLSCIFPSLIMYVVISVSSILPINNIFLMLIIKTLLGISTISVFTLLFNKAILIQIKSIFIKNK